jgi:hypothetical protein
MRASVEKGGVLTCPFSHTSGLFVPSIYSIYVIIDILSSESPPKHHKIQKQAMTILFGDFSGNSHVA